MPLGSLDLPRQPWVAFVDGARHGTTYFAYLAFAKAKTLVNLLKPNDVARRLAVSRAWVYEAARTGRIPSVRIGGDDGPLRFVPEEIEQWLAEARTAWSPGHRARETKRESSRTTARNRRGSSSSRRPPLPADQQSLL